MGRVLISRTRFQFLHKLLEFVGCSCFFIAFMSYCVIAKKKCIQFKFGNWQCICSIHIHSFLAFKNMAHSELAKREKKRLNT
jgi:hypothetical protein